jgi:hypothetical protein
MGSWTAVDPATDDPVDAQPELPGPAAFDTFEPVDVCDARLTVNGAAYELVCEVEGAHDEHEATLRWKTKPVTLPPDEWLRSRDFAGTRVIDPDGWREEGADWNRPISRDEFVERLGRCTVEDINP